MKSPDLYVTFVRICDGDKFAVRCKDIEQACVIGQDACSLASIKNVRLRRCGKPSNRLIMEYEDYWGYSKGKE